MLLTLVTAVVIVCGLWCSKTSGELLTEDADAVVTVNISVISDGDIIGLKDNFEFECSVSDPELAITLLVDGGDHSDKINRIMVDRSEDNQTTYYTFLSAIPTDNGTTFACLVSNGSKNVSSAILTVLVEYAPIFYSANNITLYHFIETNNDSVLNCSVYMANPPLNTPLRFTSDSKNTTNVIFNESSGIVTFHKSKVANGGLYRCLASNPVGNTSLSYKTFVGGSPNDVRLTVDAHTTGASEGKVSLGLEVNDHSHAPAQSLHLDLVGISQSTVNFTSRKYNLPVMNTSIPNVMSIDSKNLYAADYQLKVIASNELGSQTVYDTLQYIKGARNIDVVINKAGEVSGNLTVGMNYTFTCEVDPKNDSSGSAAHFPFTVLINGDPNNDKHNRLIKGPSSPVSQTFTFINTIPDDDNTVFTCEASGVYKSDELTISVLHAPLFMSNNVTLFKYIDKGHNESINCVVTKSNPPVSTLTATNTSKHTSNVQLSVDRASDSAVFTFVYATVSNRGIYTCTATNDIGTTTLSYKAFVGGEPDKVEVNLVSSVVNGTLLIAMELTDSSDAPGNKFHISIPGLAEKDVSLSANDVRTTGPTRLFVQLLELNQELFLAGTYSVQATAGNTLGTKSVPDSSVFVEGTLPLSVTLHTDKKAIITGHHYAFSCVADKTNETFAKLSFDVLIDNKLNTEKHSRLLRGSGTPYSQNFTFVNSTYIDDRTSFMCLVSKVYRSEATNLTVYYPPIVSVPKKVGGFRTQSFSVNVSVDHAEPPQYNVTWFKNGKPLNRSTNIAVYRNSIHFKTLHAEDTAVYSVKFDNGVLDGTTEHFQLLAYDGPFFKEGAPNNSIIVERQMKTNFSLTCTVKHSVPPVTSLTIVPENGNNWHLKRNGNESVSLVFTNGQPEINSGDFTCIAENNQTVSTLKMRNFVGGPPNDVTVNVSYYVNDTAIRIGLNITDKSDAPINGIMYHIKGIDKSNSSKTFDYLLNGSFIVFDPVVENTYHELGGDGKTNYLLIYARNDIGTALVYNYNFTVPGKRPISVLTLSVSTAVPGGVVLLIVLVLIVIGVFVCYKRKKTRRGYFSIQDDDDTAND